MPFSRRSARKYSEKRILVPDNNHTTQENTGGVWFFIAATPKHQNVPREKGAWTMQVREPRMAKNRASAVIDSSENFSSCVGREKFLHWCLVRKIEFSPLSLCSAIENYYFLNRFTLNETRGSWVPPAYCEGRGQAQEWYGSITDRRHLSKSPG